MVFIKILKLEISNIKVIKQNLMKQKIFALINDTQIN